MSKNLLMGIGALVLIIGGLLVYNSSQSGSSLQNDSSSSESLKGTLQDLFTRGVPLQCDFTYQDETEVMTSGTVYISGDDMRGDFTTIFEGAPTESHMIRMNNTVHTWSSAHPQGTKFTIDEEVMMGDVVDDAGDASFDFDNQPADYSCKPWSVDQSMFSPPTDIEFIDLTAQMEQMQELQDKMNSQQGSDDDRCAACAQLPEGEARSACLQGLGCK